MKTSFLVGLLAVCLACGSGKTVLKGHVDNYNGETVSIVPMDDYDSRDTLQVDASGNFAYTPANEESQKYVLSVHGFAPYNNCIYLGTGDQVEVNFVLSPDKTMEVQFVGDRAAENEYLQAFDAFQNSRMGYDQDMLALPFAAYKAKFDAKEQEFQALFDKVADSELKKEFDREQHLSFQSRRLSYSYAFFSRAKEGEKVSDDDFAAFVKSIDVNNPDECNQYMMWDIITWYQKSDPEYKKENWELDYLERLDRLVSNQEMKNAFATDRVKSALRAALGKPFDALMARYNQMCTDDSMRQEVAEEYAEYVRVYTNLMPGKVAPDFELISDKGETLRLSDL